MRIMKPARHFVVIAAAMLIALPVASAQYVDIPVAPGVGLPPPPPPPPPPKIEVLPVPKMDAPLPAPRANLPHRSSFSDRVARCLDEAAAMGLNTGERAEYSRSCAHR
jgi:hypothetical protein